MPIAREVYADPVIQAFIAEAAADPEIIGLLLSGSLAAGMIHPESDYDVIYVLTDDANTWPERGAGAHTSKSKDLWHDCPRGLRAAAEIGDGSYTESELLLDKTGELAELHALLAIMPEAKAKEVVEKSYDSYLNGLMRSCKAWRRGNDLGARIMAAESATWLLHTLFALERRWRPWNDRLPAKLAQLDPQGWHPGELRSLLLDLISQGDPRRQQAIAQRVIALLRARGFGHVYDDWHGEIDDVLAWSFS
jgi:uncharacterized protein DUF4037